MNSSRLEIVIKKLLEEYDSTYVADDLLKKWDRGELSEKDQDVAAQFLINSGFLNTLQNQYTKQLTQDRYISWIALLDLISKTNQTVPEKYVDPIFVGMTEMHQLDSIITAQVAKDLHPRFKKLIQSLTTDLYGKNTPSAKQRKKKKSSKKVQEEIQKLSESLKNDPSELDVARIKRLISKKEQDLSRIFDKKRPEIEEKEAKAISENVIDNAKKNPNAAYDLSILLGQMELFDAALECLSYAPASLEKDWLNLDLLVKVGDYLSAIDESFSVEKKYAKNPDTIFATLQLRAQALYGLGEKEKAIQLLEKLVETSPRNQSAKVLLHTWRTVEQ